MTASFNSRAAVLAQIGQSSRGVNSTNKVATALCIFLFLGMTLNAASTEEQHAHKLAAQLDAGPTDQLCDYCQDYSDAATGAGAITTACQVGTDYWAEEQILQIAAKLTKR